MNKVNSKPILYIKEGCPWCMDALHFFSENSIEIRICDVYQDPQSMQRLIDISGQTLTPTFEFGEFVVADFSLAEFIRALDDAPKVRKLIGLNET